MWSDLLGAIGRAAASVTEKPVQLQKRSRSRPNRWRLGCSLILTVAVSGTLAAQREGQKFRVVPRDSSKTYLYTGYGYRAQGALGASGAVRHSYAVVTIVLPNSPAEVAGLHVGDEILSINGFDLVAQNDSAKFRGPGVPAVLRVRRGERIVQLSLTPLARPRDP